MEKHRIHVYTSRNYSGYFWEFQRYNDYPTNKDQKGYWSRIRSGYAFTKWGAYKAAKRSAKKYFRYQPFEKIEELN